LSAPRDATRLRQALATSLAIDHAPSVIRYSNQQVPDEIPAAASVAGMDLVLQTDQPQVLVVGFGEMVSTAVGVGQRLADQGIGVTVLDPVWALPVNPELIRMAADHDLVISIEDNGIVGGCGARLAQEMRLADVLTPIREFGIEQRFLEHGSRSELLAELRLTPQHIARYAVEAIVRSETEPSRSSATRAPGSV